MLAPERGAMLNWAKGLEKGFPWEKMPPELGPGACGRLRYSETKRKRLGPRAGEAEAAAMA